MGRKKVQINTGDVFGSYTVIEEVASVKQRIIKCKCNCGNERIIRLNSLRSGGSVQCKSCASTTHGQYYTKLYKVYMTMIARCYNSNRVEYHNYGGRDITVCDDWKNDFLTFKTWAETNGYEEGLQIDRENNNGNYEPSNCRFVTIQVNANNRNTCVFLEYNNEKLNISEWSRKLGISDSTIRSRLKRCWSVEKTLSEPLIKNK